MPAAARQDMTINVIGKKLKTDTQIPLAHVEGCSQTTFSMLI